jgi:thioredoxin 1
MKTPMKILIVVALAATVVAAVALKQSRDKPTVENDVSSVPAATNGLAANAGDQAAPAATAKLPKLVDLGAGKCIPCKMMKPILDDLRANYADRFTTVFIDVWENPEAGKQYGIEVIPTQIFYDAEGKEVFRHVGFFSKADILGKWKGLGVDLTKE